MIRSNISSYLSCDARSKVTFTHISLIPGITMAEHKYTLILFVVITDINRLEFFKVVVMVDIQCCTLVFTPVDVSMFCIVTDLE